MQYQMTDDEIWTCYSRDVLNAVGRALNQKKEHVEIAEKTVDLLICYIEQLCGPDELHRLSERMKARANVTFPPDHVIFKVLGGPLKKAGQR